MVVQNHQEPDIILTEFHAYGSSEPSGTRYYFLRADSVDGRKAGFMGITESGNGESLRFEIRPDLPSAGGLFIDSSEGHPPRKPCDIIRTIYASDIETLSLLYTDIPLRKTDLC